MHYSTLAAVFLFALGSFAIPHQKRDTCMNQQQAEVVANNFKTLISAYTNETANAVMCSDVHDYSDSVITLMDGACAKSVSRPPFQRGPRYIDSTELSHT